MKKMIYILLLFVFCMFPGDVFAKGYVSVSDTTVTITKGSSKKFTITAYDAIGDVTIKSKDNSIATVSSSSWSTGMVGAGETKKGTITISGVNVGSTIIELVIDAASFDADNLSAIKTISVNVVEPVVDNRSKNNNLKSIGVDGHQLVKVNNNNYTLDVSNDVTSININALAEDAKATVSGAGSHEIKVGENKITVVITAENGSKNTITVKVTRKDGYYLDDLASLLKNDNTNVMSVIIKKDSKISDVELEKIKDSKKEVKFNYYDDNKKLLYSWSVKGNEISELNEFVTTISYDTDNENKISELSNYADGLYVNFSHEGKLPEGTDVKVYVGDKYEHNNLLNIYHYSQEGLSLVQKDVVVTDGYIEFEIEHCSEYFVTRSVLKIDNSVVQIEKEETNDVFKIISLIELIIIVILFLALILRKKNKVVKNEVVFSNENKVNNIFEDNSDVFVSNNQN